MQMMAQGSFRFSGLSLLALSLVAASCSKKSFDGRSHTGVVVEVKVQRQAPVEAISAAQKFNLQAVDRLTAAGGAVSASVATEGTVQLRKDRLFEREFLYGFDLQYTSSNDQQYSLIPQAQAIGHIPSFFRAIGGQLQLLANQERLFESNINHPEKLLATWDIIAEDADTITISYRNSGLILNEVFNGKGTPAPKANWVRSLKFVEQGEYILQETGITLTDDNVQTYLETIFPRENIVPAGYQGIDMDASINEVSGRYRFLSNEKVFVPRSVGTETVREQTSFASRFELGTAGTIDWYVTPNIPDRFLPIIKSGTEGWNRYYHAQLGRDVVRFMGKLPAGISIGDPRYNVINWDSVAQAGAAYESQAADPLTGIQSHSLVYLPYAWYNIGVQMWDKRVNNAMPSADQLRAFMSPKGPEVISPSHRNPLICVLSAEDMATPVAAILKSMDAPATGANGELLNTDEFGQRLMMAVLFHEVGHALGLAHNFKGSLAFDGTQAVSATNPTTASVMDYNYYQFETDLFTQIGGTDGPSLEYDRQIISQLYNHGADVAVTDDLVPACEDEEADNTDGGVDPLCVRYDSEYDPSVGVQHSFNNLAGLTGAAGTEGKTLTEVFGQLNTAAAARFNDTARNPDQAALLADAKKFGGQVAAITTYFITGGAQSVRVNLRNNSKALREWAPGIPIDEVAFRKRYTDVLKEAVALRALPDAPATALAALRTTVSATISANAAAGLTAAEREGAAQQAADAISKSVEKSVRSALIAMRTSIYGELAYKEASPFAIRVGSGAALSHYEELAADILAQGVLMSLNSDAAQLAASAGERDAAAKQLATFKGISPVVEQTLAQLEALVIRGRNEGNADMVNESRKLIKKLRE